MVETYFTLALFSEYIIPAILVTIIAIGIGIVFIQEKMDDLFR